MPLLPHRFLAAHFFNRVAETPPAPSSLGSIPIPLYFSLTDCPSAVRCSLRRALSLSLCELSLIIEVTEEFSALRRAAAINSRGCRRRPSGLAVAVANSAVVERDIAALRLTPNVVG